MKNGAKVKGFYATAARGEMNVLFEALAPTIEWREAENSPFASGNPYVGPEAVGKLLANIGEEIEGLAIVPMNVIDGVDSVVVEGRYKGKIRETGNVMDAAVRARLAVSRRQGRAVSAVHGHDAVARIERIGSRARPAGLRLRAAHRGITIA